MMLPFTREQFFQVFVEYNTAVWPMQVALVLAAAGRVNAVASRRGTLQPSG